MQYTKISRICQIIDCHIEKSKEQEIKLATYKISANVTMHQNVKALVGK